MNGEATSNQNTVSSESGLSSEEESSTIATKKTDEMNENTNQNNNQDSVESQVKPSSQEESNNLASKRKPNNISPPEHQSKNKMANFSTTPKTASNDNSNS